MWKFTYRGQEYLSILQKMKSTWEDSSTDHSSRNNFEKCFLKFGNFNPTFCTQISDKRLKSQWSLENFINATSLQFFNTNITPQRSPRSYYYLGKGTIANFFIACSKVQRWLLLSIFSDNYWINRLYLKIMEILSSWNLLLRIVRPKEDYFQTESRLRNLEISLRF